MYEEIKASARAAAEEICEAAGLKKGADSRGGLFLQRGLRG